MTMIADGNYKARITGYGLSESKSGTPRVQVSFEFDDGTGNISKLSWFGYLTEKAASGTLKRLLTMGFTGSDPLELADPNKNLLTHEPLDIVVQNSEFEGKTSPKVVGIFAGRPKMTPSQAQVKLGALNLKGQLAAIREEKNKTPEQPKAPEVDDSGDPLPF